MTVSIAAMQRAVEYAGGVRKLALAMGAPRMTVSRAATSGRLPERGRLNGEAFAAAVERATDGAVKAADLGVSRELPEPAAEPETVSGVLERLRVQQREIDVALKRERLAEVKRANAVAAGELVSAAAVEAACGRAGTAMRRGIDASVAVVRGTCRRHGLEAEVTAAICADLSERLEAMGEAVGSALASALGD